MNTCSLTVSNVMDAKLGRKAALHKYVLGDAKLREEFYEGVKKAVYTMTPAEATEALDNFIKRKAIVILSEKPFVKLDEERNWYRVNVIYTIAV